MPEENIENHLLLDPQADMSTHSVGWAMFKLNTMILNDKHSLYTGDYTLECGAVEYHRAASIMFTSEDIYRVILNSHFVHDKWVVSWEPRNGGERYSVGSDGA